MMRSTLAVLTALIFSSLLCLAAVSNPGPVRDTDHLNVQLVAMTSRPTAFSRAWAKRGGWYRWGGNGPSSYDCSGLMYYAYRHKIPRTAAAIRHSSVTVHVSRWKAKRGDLVFHGNGHVEMVYDFNRNRTKMRTYGAHHSGTRISVTRWHPVWHIEHVRGS